jgi:hypothetical protein
MGLSLFLSLSPLSLSLRTCRSGTITNSHINSCIFKVLFSNKFFKNRFSVCVAVSRNLSGGGFKSKASGFNISDNVGMKVSGNSNEICCRINRKSSSDLRTVTMDCRSPCCNWIPSSCQYLHTLLKSSHNTPKILTVPHFIIYMTLASCTSALVIVHCRSKSLPTGFRNNVISEPRPKINVA